MKGLAAELNKLDSFSKIAEALKKHKSPILATGVLDSQKAHLTYALQQQGTVPSLIITATETKAKTFYEDMQFFLADKVKLYPSKDIIFYSADLKSMEIEAQRFSVLHSLMEEEGATVVLSVESLFDRLVKKEVFSRHIMNLEVSMEISIEALSKKLVLMGYERRELVEAAGQFAVRGGIVDLYTALAENAFRIEFWGDEIDSIRLLDSVSQRSIEKIDSILLFPMRELVYSENELDTAIEKIEQEYKKQCLRYEKKGLAEAGEKLREYIGGAIDKLREEKSFPGVDKYIQYFYEDTVSILDYLEKDTLIIFDEPSRIFEAAGQILFEFEESVKNRIEKGYLLPKQAEMLYTYENILAEAKKFNQVLYTTLAHSVKGFSPALLTDFAVKSAELSGQPRQMDEELAYYRDNKYKIVLLAGLKSRAERLIKELSGRGFPVTSAERTSELQEGVITVSKGSLNSGFEYPGIRLVVFTDKELSTDGNKKSGRGKKKKAAKIEVFTDLRVGDYVVHDNYGIAVYRGIEKITVDGTAKDYLKLSYRDGGHLYVATTQMDMIQKYIGAEAAKPKLNSLSGQEWSKAKSRTRAAVEILAKDLVELYAARQNAKGFQFTGDTVWQKEFEESFPFIETDDQLTAIEEMKNDMESAKVMDRLVCGDVGYGKTEVAIRGAFKAVQDGKQVAYLVPTTILAQQHYNTFVQRMKDFPVNIEMLSRFRTVKQQEEIRKNAEKGLVDIIIGTHSLLSKQMKFKDLGLVIVDEEQRFGVAHKEKLKRLRQDVDVLTLTATPIPRTLHMSLTGIRDMSILEEPPRERQPIQTYVMEYNPEFVRDAVRRELSRGGQVYYLHNRVRNISEIAKRVQDLVPEANVSYAHGQMTERELERIMLGFIEKDIDVLVCTTIIETGLDIPNVNTIIIQDADRMGLAQLYQLRGRVGRSNRIAYAYLMYKKDKILQETAEKRLQTIREFTEFGSGFKIAMRDLEIRGAGNMLGAEQHGHMDTVGYDMYCKLLGDAVKDIQGEERTEEFETSVDINIDGYIPSYYIENEEQKLEIYKKIAYIKNQEDYNEIQEEIEDRFGNLPEPVQNLLEVALLKACAHRLDVTSIKQRQNKITLLLKNNADVDPNKIMAACLKYKDKLLFTLSGVPCMTYMIPGEGIGYMKELRQILLEIGR